MTEATVGGSGGGHFMPSNQVISVSQGGYTVLLDVATSRYYSLDTIGGRIWSLLCDQIDTAAIAETLASEYVGDSRTIAADVNKLVSKLTAAHLVVPAEQGTRS